MCISFNITWKIKESVILIIPSFLLLLPWSSCLCRTCNSISPFCVCAEWILGQILPWCYCWSLFGCVKVFSFTECKGKYTWFSSHTLRRKLTSLDIRPHLLTGAYKSATVNFSKRIVAILECSLDKLLGDFYYGSDTWVAVPVWKLVHFSAAAARMQIFSYPDCTVSFHCHPRSSAKLKKNLHSPTLSSVLPYLNYDIQSCQVAVLLGSDNPEDEKRPATQSQ